MYELMSLINFIRNSPALSYEIVGKNRLIHHGSIQKTNKSYGDFTIVNFTDHATLDNKKYFV